MIKPAIRTKKPVTNDEIGMDASQLYVQYEKTLVPVQYFNRHLIRACKKLMITGSEMLKAYCEMLFEKLEMQG